jgi:hypothetical protein
MWWCDEWHFDPPHNRSVRSTALLHVVADLRCFRFFFCSSSSLCFVSVLFFFVSVFCCYFRSLFYFAVSFLDLVFCVSVFLVSGCLFLDFVPWCAASSSLVLPAAFRPPLCSCWEWNPDLALFRALCSARFGACLWR